LAQAIPEEVQAAVIGVQINGQSALKERLDHPADITFVSGRVGESK